MTKPVIRIPNWQEFQQYKDRNPPWIKLHKQLLQNREWEEMSGEACKFLVELWLLASESKDGTIAVATDDLAWRCRRDTDQVATLLVELELSGFLDLSVHDVATVIDTAPAEKWPSRYVPRSVRDEVMERDGRKCTACGGTADLEIDHIKPISAGGRGVADNLQVLCRRCNRRKRSRTVRYAPVQNAAPEGEERESRGEREKLHGASGIELKPAYTRGELIEAAKRQCGLGVWDRQEEGRANSVIVSWYGEGIKPERIWAAIHGARILCDAGKVEWLAKGKPFGLRALRNTHTLYDQGDGRAERPMFDVAEEAYYADATPSNSKTRKLGRISVSLPDGPNGGAAA